METKISKDRMVEFGRRLGVYDYCIVEGVGTADGIGLFWRKGVNIRIISSCKQFIITEVIDGANLGKWILCCGHCPNSLVGKSTFWNNIIEQINAMDLEWIIVGDLNEVVSQSEKLGRRRVRSSNYCWLRNMMMEYGAADLGFSRPPCT